MDVRALGCDAYAGAGQKWLCGPDGLGMLYVAPALRERLSVSRRGYGNLLDPGAGLDAQLHEDGRRFDTFALSAEALATALAAVRDARASRLGMRCTSARSRRPHDLRRAVDGRRSRGFPARSSTLVSFSSPDPLAERTHLAERGVVLRDIPDHPWLRASVGAWNDESDFQRLLAGLLGQRG